MAINCYIFHRVSYFPILEMTWCCRATEVKLAVWRISKGATDGPPSFCEHHYRFTLPCCLIFFFLQVGFYLKGEDDYKFQTLKTSVGALKVTGPPKVSLMVKLETLETKIGHNVLLENDSVNELMVIQTLGCRNGVHSSCLMWWRKGGKTLDAKTQLFLVVYRAPSLCSLCFCDFCAHLAKICFTQMISDRWCMKIYISDQWVKGVLRVCLKPYWSFNHYYFCFLVHQAK